MKKTILIIFVILGLFAVINIAIAASSTPGSDSDPLITSSYLDKKLSDISTSLQNTVSALQTKIDQNNSNLVTIDKKVEEISKQGGGSAQVFEVVNLSSGSKMICKASTEIILRSGTAEVQSQNQSGLSDVTIGLDIKPKETVLKNHLLIVPRDDGRGLLAKTKCVLMVKGGYTIE